MNIMYKVCKRTIERGNYPSDMKEQIEAFYKVNFISKEEYNELIKEV